MLMLVFAPRSAVLMVPTLAIRLLNPEIGNWATSDASAPVLTMPKLLRFPTPATT
jgi:hypothetical protein